VLAELRTETAAHFPQGARMQVSPDQGAFLAWLVHTLGASKILEVGVFTGYSSVAMALALPPGGMVVACEKDTRCLEMARTYWEKAGVQDKVRHCDLSYSRLQGNW
jgi:predicted O-methyltransferase YrrM